MKGTLFTVIVVLYRACGCFALRRVGNNFQSEYSLQKQLAYAKDNNTIFVYLHVPKCAGTSFAKNILHNPGTALPKDKHWWPNDNTAYKCGYQAPGIHCSTGELESCLMHFKPDTVSSNIRFITILRHPVERVLSEYYFISNFIKIHGKNMTNPLYYRFWSPRLTKMAMSGELTLHKWLTAYDNNGHNRAAKMILSVDRKAPVMLGDTFGHGKNHSTCLSFEYAEYVKYWHKEWNKGSTVKDMEESINSDKDWLNQALQLVDTRFAYIGIQDQFEQSVLGLQKFFNMNQTVLQEPDKPFSEHRSHKPDDENIPQEDINVILEKNQLDLSLYNHVCKQFASSCKDYNNFHGTLSLKSVLKEDMM